jgi:hypothetical protein
MGSQQAERFFSHQIAGLAPGPPSGTATVSVHKKTSARVDRAAAPGYVRCCDELLQRWQSDAHAR